MTHEIYFRFSKEFLQFYPIHNNMFARTKCLYFISGKKWETIILESEDRFETLNYSVTLANI